MVDFTIEDNCYVNDRFIGTAVAKRITVNILNPNNETNLENKEIQVYAGVNDELVPFGNFIIEEPPDNQEVQEKTSFEGYDYMIKFDALYKDTNTYPIRLDDYLENLCNQVGIELGSKNIINADYMVQGNSFQNGEDCKTVLSNIAQIACGFAHIGFDNKLYIVSLTADKEAEEIIDGNNYINFSKNNLFGTVNSVCIKMNSGVDGEESVREAEGVTEENRCQITITDNYILTTAEQRELVIDNIFNAINGITYLPCKFDYYGYPWLGLGDKINVLDTNDNEQTTYLFNHTFKFNGGFSGTIENPALTKTQSAYRNTRDLKTWRKNTELTVNKINGEITQLIKEIYEEDGIINENFTQVYQDIKNVITNVQNSGGANLIKNSVMFAYDTNNIPEEWELSGDGTLNINSSSEAFNAGSVSGHVFTLNNKTVKQRVYVKADSSNIPENEKTYYTFSTKIKKETIGIAYVKISNANEEYIIKLNEGQSSFYGDFEIKELLPKMNYYDIEFYGSEGSNATFTDNMFAIGKYKTQWSQASGEIMNTQVNININGVLVKSSVFEGDYTVMSPLEFAGYSQINGVKTKVFTINKDTTEVEKLKAKNGITMPPIKVVPVTSGALQGWAFVPSN